MNVPVFALLGLGSGAAYVIMALGLLVIYRGSGVVYFAIGAQAMITTLMYESAAANHELVIPVPGVPAWQLPGLNTAEAIAIAVAASALLGAGIYLLVFHHLRRRPPLASTAASVGLLILFEGVAVLCFGSTAVGGVVVGSLLPTHPLHIGGYTVGENEFYLVGVVAIVTLACWVLFKYSKAGVAIRANAENQRGAALLGWSPAVLGTATWVTASVLTTAMGIVGTSVLPVNETTYPLLVIPALCVALIARFRSFTTLLVAGLALGAIESAVSYLTSRYTWLPSIGVTEGVPLLLIIILMVVGGDLIPRRGFTTNAMMPRAYAPRRVPVKAPVLIALVAIAAPLLHGELRYALITSMVAALLCLSLVILTGFAGQVSLAQMEIAGVAGFMLIKLGGQWGIPFPFAPLLAALIAMGFGLLIGLPAIRVRGVNFAIITLVAAVAADNLLFSNPSFSGGYDGGTVPTPRLFGIDLGVSGQGGTFRLQFVYLVLIVLAITCLATVNLRRSNTGFRLLAIRANERAATAAGLNVPRMKLLAFALASFIAGIGGTLLAYQQSGGNLAPDQFSVFVSLTLLAGAYLGGISTVAGALIGGFIYGGGLLAAIIVTWVPSYSQYVLVIGGLGLVIVAVQQPEGIAGAYIEGVRSIRQRSIGRKARTPVMRADTTAESQSPDHPKTMVE